jgi:FKBP-type peptidyl-prolyl cis-trans isomerase SlyD
MIDTIRDGAVVQIAYTLKLANGEVIDYTEVDDPLEYLHGADNIIPGLERELTGLGAGDKKDVRVAPADGYGEYDPSEVEEISTSELPPGMPVKVGMIMAIPDDDGSMMEAMVTAVTKSTVTLDFNHPLAGKPLFFSVEILGIRDATEEELAAGHPAGMDFEDDFGDDDFDDFDDDDFDDFDEYEEGDDDNDDAPPPRKPSQLN